MFSMLAILVYLLAMGLPVWLLYRFGSLAWPWHFVAIAAAVVLGFVPTPVAFRGAAADLLAGFLFTFLAVWGIGGLIVHRPHVHRHA